MPSIRNLAVLAAAQPSDLKLEPFNCSPEGVNGAIRK